LKILALEEIMKISSTTGFAGAVGMALLFAFSAVAHDRSILNGTWTLVPAKSDFAGEPVVQTGTVRIEDQTGVIVITRHFTYEGANETVFYNDSTGSENNSTIHSGKELKTKTKWDHDVLRVTTTRSGAVTLESYSLAADGTMMVNVERPGRKPFTMVFQRQ
jgi:hypothetical protein